MILADLRIFLQSKQRVSLDELVVHFQIEADALRGMLSKWIKKGKVRQLQSGGPSCGTSCCQCNPLLTELYEWHDESQPF
ncbi:FeoC-like transcriptional regulator [Methylomonas sp. AM2-LC]|uniref:FeoC-like transcriptional regulator n=1 Tax=Methylomonas sp. AM2-LC TaxID=3153301 RepID=UPI003264C0E2